MTSATLSTDLTDYLRCPAMQAEALDIPDVLLIEPGLYADERGHFYEAWNEEGVSTQEALRRARAAVVAKHPHPACWAAWVVWGTPR